MKNLLKLDDVETDNYKIKDGKLTITGTCKVDWEKIKKMFKSRDVIEEDAKFIKRISISIFKRISLNGIGYYFQDATGFENIKIIDCSGLYRIISFDYKNKHHKLRLYEGRYGDNFTLNNSTYYVIEKESNI